MGIFQQIASTAQPSSQNGSVSFPPPVQNTQDQSTGVTGPMPQGKGASGQRFTYSPTSGQPAMGQPNRYANTVSQWDNASIQRPAYSSGGKGKG